MGLFEVSEANRTVKCLELKAYDYICCGLRRIFNGFESVGTASRFCEPVLGTSVMWRWQVSEAWYLAQANGNTPLDLSDNDIETLLDVLLRGRSLGGFFCINRAGKLSFGSFGNEPR